MAASNATAHVLIVEGLRDIISSCKKIGASYNPDFPEIRIQALESQLALAEQHQKAVKEKVNAFYTISNDRTLRYARLPAVCNRLQLILSEAAIPDETFRTAARINNIVQETRLYKNFSIAEYEALEGSSSKAPEGRSYEHLEHYFAQLLAIVASLGDAFQPEDAELSYPALQHYLTQLRHSNRLIIQALNEVHHARQKRNELLPLFAETHRHLHKKVHTYIRKSFGQSSWQHQLIING